MANFYVVSTPIGNLEDITLRAVRVLGEVDTIFCEDTRQTKKLLSKFNLHTKTESFHARSLEGQVQKVFSLIREGKDLALVSDAGTPCISDPGTALIERLRKEFSTEELHIVPIPGASALTAALSVSGLPTNGFLFLGFLPHKKGRRGVYKEIENSERTVIFYESPHRILKTLKDLSELMPERRAAICRELTKIYEEVNVHTLKNLYQDYASRKKILGEFTILVAPSR